MRSGAQDDPSTRPCGCTTRTSIGRWGRSRTRRPRSAGLGSHSSPG